MIPIKDIMTSKVITVHENTQIVEAMRLLIDNSISGMPVVDEHDHLVGIFSEKDALEMLVKKDFNAKHTVSEYMTTRVTFFAEDSDAVEICKFFMKSSVRRVPIVTAGKVVGVVSRRDIVELILKMSLDHKYY